MQKHPEPHAAASCKPILKWVGGKSRILNQILPQLPTGRRLIEPFVGGGAVFLGTNYEEYVLCDRNAHLVELYSAVANQCEDFLAVAAPYFTEDFRSKEQYLEVREAFNQERDPLARAAKFLYLNRFGFNGLCRYNRSGGFNVPYGAPKALPRFPADRVHAFRDKARRSSFMCADFADAMRMAERGDVVYCDPPYLPRDDSTASFTGYTAARFGIERQKELAALASDLSARGIPVVISNHDCEVARQIYKKARLITLEARRSVSADSNGRSSVRELLAIFER
ncbi:Dam family site-specific DNA-(adenine-N6)-methyltransferase [Paraburkholderia bengalensis]|uniref:Site-specific DNA-methyltransferase (adenine-specific) n=1 Tax=Paraburkholderia bengalensis TaxID=2747562 RepID=A0ABU8J2R6_9BURK